MNRRTFLLSGASLTLGVHSQTQLTNNSSDYSSDNSSDNSSTDWCAQNVTPEDMKPLRVPQENEDFIVSGTKDVKVWWKSDEFFNKAGFPFAYAFAIVGGEKIFLNESNKAYIDDYVLLHELAHSLGYKHGDGGIVDTDTPVESNTKDRSVSIDTLADTTTDVAQSFDAYDFIDSWDIQELGETGSEFAEDDTSITQLGTAGQLFASESTREDIFIENSHNGFGGAFDSGFNDTADNVLAGRYYKEE